MAKGSGGGAFGAASSRRTQVHIEGLPELKKTLTKVMPREARNILRRTVTVHWYENREAVLVGSVATPMPMAVESILSRYRVPGIA